MIDYNLIMKRIKLFLFFHAIFFLMPRQESITRKTVVIVEASEYKISIFDLIHCPVTALLCSRDDSRVDLSEFITEHNITGRDL